MKSQTTKYLLGLLVFLLFSGNILAQNSQNVNLFSVTDAQIKKYVEEVYAHEAEMVFNDEQRMKDINDLLKNRVEIYRMNDGYREKSKEMKNFSTIGLLSFNNPNLKKDNSFNPKNFNPLKYDLDFYPLGTAAYQVNGSYVILIKSQRQ